MFDMAKEHKGAMLNTEHRFYGKSMPLSDYTTESLKYLSSEQALADLAHFITTIKDIIPGSKNSSVVVVGCSYSASLATWSRLKYPDLIDAAYASSGPIIAIDDFYRYQEVVGDVIASNSAECYSTLEEAITEMEKLFATEDGRKELQKTLNTCRPIEEKEPFKSFLYWNIATEFNTMVQMAQPYKVIVECYALTLKQGTSLHKLAAYLKEKNNQCVPDYTDLIRFFNNTATDTRGGRQFWFQQCNEFGFFQTTSSTKQPFGNHVLVDYFHRICKDLYGDEYSPETIRKNIEHTNQVYGGFNKDLSYVISVYGSVDPWYPLTLITALNDLTPAFEAIGYAHCYDLYSMSPNDSPEMTKVKQGVKDQITKWLA